MNQLISNGSCPQCDLSGQKYKVYFNKGDRWECPKCHLQLQTIADGYLGIGMERGNGYLKEQEYDSRIMGSRILLRSPLFEGDDRLIKDKSELIDYLKLCTLKSSI